MCMFLQFDSTILLCHHGHLVRPKQRISRSQAVVGSRDCSCKTEPASYVALPCQNALPPCASTRGLISATNDRPALLLSAETRAMPTSNDRTNSASSAGLSFT